MAQLLTTLDSVKGWLGLPLTPSPSDPTLYTCINGATSAIMAYIGRQTVLPRGWSETHDGRLNGRRIFLDVFPVISIGTVVVDNRVVLPYDEDRIGEPYYRLHENTNSCPGVSQYVDLYNVRTYRGRQNVLVTYDAGYQYSESLTIEEVDVTDSSGTVTQVCQVVASAPYGAWAMDVSVSYIDGAMLNKVSSSPGKGEYQVDNGTYTFNAADIGEQVAISYGYIPSDLTSACIQMAALTFKMGSNVGLRSKSIGGQETVAYSTSIPSTVTQMLNPYILRGII